MDGSSWNLLLQIPVAGVLVIVVILFLRHLKDLSTAYMDAMNTQSQAHTSAAAEQARAYASAQVEQARITASAQKEQTDLFMGAIANQREQNNRVVADLAENVKNLGLLVTNSLTRMESAFGRK
jgi:hypothetical protein